MGTGPMARLQGLLGSPYSDLATMVCEASTASLPVLCYITRNKSRMGSIRYDFFISMPASNVAPLKEVHCFSGRRSSSKETAYVITLGDSGRAGSKGKDDELVGTVRTNREAMDYTLYDGGMPPFGSKDVTPEELKLSAGAEEKDRRRQMMHVHFTNSLRNDKPGAMLVGVPSVDQASGESVLHHDGLAARLAQPAPADVTVFKNREPEFNPRTKTFELDFRGRATQASAKNMQLTHRDGDSSYSELLLGKVDDDRFNVDFQYPFSALQAFAFALVIFVNSSSSMTL